MWVTLKSVNNVRKTSKNNKPYTQVQITTHEHGDRMLTSFPDDINKNWRENDLVSIIVEDKGYKNLNFTAQNPDKEAQSIDDYQRPKNPIEQGIDERHHDRQDGMALGNAKTNATAILVAMIGKASKEFGKEEIRTVWNRLVDHIYFYKPEELPFKAEPELHYNDDPNQQEPPF